MTFLRDHSTPGYDENCHLWQQAYPTQIDQLRTPSHQYSSCGCIYGHLGCPTDQFYMVSNKNLIFKCKLNGKVVFFHNCKIIESNQQTC